MIKAEYCYKHIDMLPLGDMAATMVTLISANPDVDFVYRYETDQKGFTLDTREVRQDVYKRQEHTSLFGLKAGYPPFYSSDKRA